METKHKMTLSLLCFWRSFGKKRCVCMNLCLPKFVLDTIRRPEGLCLTVVVFIVFGAHLKFLSKDYSM